ncbi:unnamed protein product [Cladocopium goreaui]|uniref:Uncharacterized protein n=1 Tax=Cladocopium goreaui TaxID=2562237 RepID=A0A9P1FMJ1_9DINO|nr:unnamed protein product [Cladocopium goreaui]
MALPDLDDHLAENGVDPALSSHLISSDPPAIRYGFPPSASAEDISSPTFHIQLYSGPSFCQRRVDSHTAHLIISNNLTAPELTAHYWQFDIKLSLAQRIYIKFIHLHAGLGCEFAILPQFADH